MTLSISHRAAILPLFASAVLVVPAFSQSSPAAKPATTPAHRPASTTAAGPKLPPGVPVVHGVLRTAFSLRYEDYKLGTGKPAEPGKLYKVHYTGWLASDGKKFDSSFDHRRPVLDKDGKPENDADGKPKLGDPEPIQFPQGRRGVIPGWDQGFTGMKVGGKRRLFIPYQLAYGELGRPPVIPPKSDLIFDIELVDVDDMPTAPAGGMRPGMPHPMPARPGTVPNNAPGTPAPPTGSPATQPTTPPPANAPAKPTDPTAPTVAPNSAPPPATPKPTEPAPTSPTAPPDKPANPEAPPA